MPEVWDGILSMLWSGDSMIDTDKYEGHTEGKWNVIMDDEMEGFYFFHQGYNRELEEDYDYNESRANARLMSDAPLLLAEVERLREETSILKNALRSLGFSSHSYSYEVNRILEGDEE